MDCDPFSLWLRLVLNGLAGGLLGYWWNRVRYIRREQHEIAAMRARVEENLVRSAILLAQLDAFPGDDHDPPAPPSRH
jgi:hypothetical protein